MSPPRGPRPTVTIQLSDAERTALEALAHRHSTPQQLAVRARIILAAAAGQRNRQIARELQVARETVRLWRQRWQQLQGVPLEEQRVADRLTDQPRPGAPGRITPEQWCQLVALVGEVPEDSDRPIRPWTSREIADEAVKRGLVERISPRHVGRFLKGDGPQAAPDAVLADAAPAGNGGRGTRRSGKGVRSSGKPPPGGSGRTHGEYRRADRGASRGT
jgi:putative transposase